MSASASANPRSLPVNRIGANASTPATSTDSAGVAWFDHLPEVTEPSPVEVDLSPTAARPPSEEVEVPAVPPAPPATSLTPSNGLPEPAGNSVAAMATAPVAIAAPAEPAAITALTATDALSAITAPATMAAPVDLHTPSKPRKIRRKRSGKGWIEIVPDLYVERKTLRRLRLLSITLITLVGLWAVQHCVKPSMHEFLDAAFLNPSVAVAENTFPRLNAMARQLQQLRYLEAFSHSQARTANVLRFASSVIPAGVRVTGMDVDGVTGGRCHVRITVRCSDNTVVQTYIDNLRVLIPGMALSSKTKSEDDDVSYVIENGPGERS